MITLVLEQWLPVRFSISTLVLLFGRRELQLRSEPANEGSRSGKDLFGHVSLDLKIREEELFHLDSLYRDPPHPSWLIWQRFKAPQPRPWSEASRQLAYLGFDSGTIESARLVLTYANQAGRFVLGTTPLYAGVLETFGRLRLALFTRTASGEGYIVDSVWSEPATNELVGPRFGGNTAPLGIRWLYEANDGKWWWPELRRAGTGWAANTGTLHAVKKMFTTLGFEPTLADILRE